MKLVYICSPLKGDMKSNIKKANEYCSCAAKMEVIPLAPHTIFSQYLDDTLPDQRRQALQMGLELLSRCDELWVCGNVISEGMRGEIVFAQMHGIPIRYYSCPEIMANVNSISTLADRVTAAKEARPNRENRIKKTKFMTI